jgi:translation initiation factor 2 subunit 2
MSDDSAKIEKMAKEEGDDLAFDPSMKKKAPPRKKSVSFEDSASAEIIPDPEQGISPCGTEMLTKGGEPAEEDMFAGLKKKKAKKPVLDAEEAPADETPAGEGNDLDFSSLKKKKKKRVIDDKVAALEAELEEAGVVEDKEEPDGADPFAKGEGEGEEVEDHEAEEEAWLKSDRDYTYEEVQFPVCLQ